MNTAGPARTQTGPAGPARLSVVAGMLTGMDGDEQLLRSRVYGVEHDDPNPGPRPERTYAELVGVLRDI